MPGKCEKNDSAKTTSYFSIVANCSGRCAALQGLDPNLPVEEVDRLGVDIAARHIPPCMLLQVTRHATVADANSSSLIGWHRSKPSSVTIPSSFSAERASFEK